MRTHLTAQVVPAPLPDPSTYGYSHGLASGNLLFIAGQCGTEGAADEALSPDFADQARRVLDRMESVVVAAGGTRTDIVSMTVYVTDIRNGALFTQIRRDFFGHHYPTSALVAVSALMPPGALVEAQGMAVLGTKPVTTSEGRRDDHA